MKKIAVLTSGGDAPGMNACIRAVARTALYHGLEVNGIMRGYEGMINGEFIPLYASSVSNIIQLGGTMLKTARSNRFMTPEGMESAAKQLKMHNIDGVVVIGGNGTLKGAGEFSALYDAAAFVGVPGTIDNDLKGTDYTIGYETAINTVVSAVDKIRDTAESHERLFFVEVMGRDAGLIALYSGIGVGSEAILIPETPTDIEKLINRLEHGRKNKSSKIIIVAEGDVAGGAFTIAEKVKDRLGYYDTRVTVLGHIQRGGSPVCRDRVMASRMGFAAVEALLQGEKNVMIGIVNDQVVQTPFKNAVKHMHELNPGLLRMVEILSA